MEAQQSLYFERSSKLETRRLDMSGEVVRLKDVYKEVAVALESPEDSPVSAKCLRDLLAQHTIFEQLAAVERKVSLLAGDVPKDLLTQARPEPAENLPSRVSSWGTLKTPKTN